MTNKTYSKVNLFIRASIFSIFSIIAIMGYSLFVVTLFFLPLRQRHALIRGFLKMYLYVLQKICLIDYQVIGIENIPKDRTGIVMSKHQSTWETFFLPLLFHDPAIILKKQLLWVPFFGWGLAAANPIAIDRTNKNTAMEQIITKGKACLAAGRWILVFPEGTRVPYGQVGRYRLGGARLAAATGYPVIPIAHNAGRFWAKRQFIKKPGTITIVIGPLIESEHRTAEEILTLAKNWIEETVQRIDAII